MDAPKIIIPLALARDVVARRHEAMAEFEEAVRARNAALVPGPWVQFKPSPTFWWRQWPLGSYAAGSNGEGWRVWRDRTERPAPGRENENMVAFGPETGEVGRALADKILEDLAIAQGWAEMAPPTVLPPLAEGFSWGEPNMAGDIRLYYEHQECHYYEAKPTDREGLEAIVQRFNAAPKPPVEISAEHQRDCREIRELLEATYTDETSVFDINDLLASRGWRPFQIEWLRLWLGPKDRLVRVIMRELRSRGKKT